MTAPGDSQLSVPRRAPRLEAARVRQRLAQRLFGVAKPAPRIAGYEIVERLGAGAYGDVYRVHDPRLDRDLAIKVLRGPVSDDWGAEARSLAQLAHPNVVAVYDVGVSDDVDLSVPGTMAETIEVRRRGTDEVVEGALEFFNPVVPAAALSEVVFPVEVKKEGVFDLVFRIGDEEVTKSLHVGHQEGLPALSPARSNGLMDLILYPTEPHFGSDSSFEQIRLVHPSGAGGYPTKPLPAFGLDLSFENELGMGLWFVLISIPVAFAFKGVFGVEF